MIRTVIIEDEALIRKSLCKLVSESSLGFDVIGEGANGVEGLHLAKSDYPDLIITDIKMPLMSGLELIKTLSPMASIVSLSYCQVTVILVMPKKRSIMVSAIICLNPYGQKN